MSGSKLLTLDDTMVSSPLIKLKKLFEYFANSNYSQTSLFHKDVKSLKYIHTLYGNNPEEFMNSVNETLHQYLSQYFDGDIEIVFGEIVDNYLPISISVNEDEGKVTLESSFIFENNKITTDSIYTKIE